MLTHGSLFTGYGGLDQAVEAVFGAETVWVSDIEQYDKKGHKIGNAPLILAHRYPGVPNLGDITLIQWESDCPDCGEKLAVYWLGADQHKGWWCADCKREVDQAELPATAPALVDLVSGGSPCQDISTAGRLAGMTEGTRSNLWVVMREAIRILQPAYIIWENVRGSLSAPADSALEPCPGCVGADGGGLLCEHLDVFSETWPASGSMRNGSAFRRPAWAPRTDAGASSSLLPTPSASLGSNGGSQPPEKRRGGVTRCNCMTCSNISLLPTSTASDRFGPGTHGTGGPDLRTAVTQL